MLTTAVSFIPRPNTHGCTDCAVGVIVGGGYNSVNVRIVHVENCTSCWQVGHGHDHEFARVGDVITVPVSDLRPADWTHNNWGVRVTWQVQA